MAQALPLNDSKQLTASQQQALRAEIEAKAITWSVAFVSPEEIDAMNILQASFEAMRRAVRGLAGEPDHLLIDGNRFVSAPDMPPHSCFVKGDAKGVHPAANILAKTHRDEYMLHAAETYNGMDGTPTWGIQQWRIARRLWSWVRHTASGHIQVGSTGPNAV